jgi:quercetin dioxygenase-like cupin family protein
MVMTTRALLVTLLFIATAAVAGAQDPTKVAPESYKLQFENNWVQVTRVHYAPYAKVPIHNHTRWPAAYVYLNDSGPIKFTHEGWDEPVLTRPPTKAGSFRLSPTTAIAETHQVENPNGIPSDFLRVEFKTTPLDRALMRGRFERKAPPSGKNSRKVEFENGQIRVTRLVGAARKTLDLGTSSTRPALIVTLTSGRVKSIGQGEAKTKSFEPGDTVWIDNGQRQRLENLGNSPIELLVFDLKTSPANP